RAAHTWGHGNHGTRGADPHRGKDGFDRVGPAQQRIGAEGADHPPASAMKPKGVHSHSRGPPARHMCRRPQSSFPCYPVSIVKTPRRGWAVWAVWSSYGFTPHDSLLRNGFRLQKRRFTNSAKSAIRPFLNISL